MREMETMSLDIVVPLYNDEEVVELLCETVLSTIGNKFQSVRLILVDDGSQDRTNLVARKISQKKEEVEYIRLAGNFGQHRAISAGLKFTTSSLVAVMDSDLQDRPEDIIHLVQKMHEEDNPMAIARRKKRSASLFKRVSSRAFALTSNFLVPFKVDPNLGAFRVMDQSIVSELNQVNETTGTPFSLLYSMSVPFSTVDLDRSPRVAGSTGYNLRKSFRLASDRIMTYSIKPIRLAIMLGIISGLFSLGVAAYTIINYGIQDKVAPGWTSIAFLTSFFGGMNLLFMGILGEYIGRIYLESRGVPRYLIRYSTLEKPNIESNKE
ncbi:MAG: hypothetical protein CMB54_00205 [Euryarchaeota archaeon]|nr:hypothetical protein [Euryarchaeota archaeon]